MLSVVIEINRMFICKLPLHSWRCGGRTRPNYTDWHNKVSAGAPKGLCVFQAANRAANGTTYDRTVSQLANSTIATYKHRTCYCSALRNVWPTGILPYLHTVCPLDAASRRKECLVFSPLELTTRILPTNQKRIIVIAQTLSFPPSPLPLCQSQEPSFLPSSSLELESSLPTSPTLYITHKCINYQA